MAITAKPEAPAWARVRAEAYVKKHMDESALVPFDQLSPDEQRRQQGRWLAYTYTLDDPKRTYVYDAAVMLVAHYAAKQPDSFYLADLGAGNGYNTIKTTRALSKRQGALNVVYLVEQAGAALDEARKHFGRNGFAGAIEGPAPTKLNFVQKDITDTGLPENLFDAVTCVNVFHHLPTWEKLQDTASEIQRILKPGGLFVVIDTRPLPEKGFKRKIIEGKIRGAVKYERFLERAAKESKNLDEAMKMGIKDFCEHDAFKAFENALAKTEFEEVMRRSALAPSILMVSDLRTSHPFFKLVYPPLNIAWGIKQ